MHTVFTEHAPAPVGAYSQATVHGGIAYCSGQIALDPLTGELRTGDIRSETRLVLANLDAVLARAGTSRRNVLKCTVFVADMEQFGEINAVYGEFFGETDPPARELVEVARLPKDVNVEISAIAAIPTEAR